MSHAFSSSRRSGVLLFDEDFDLPPRRYEPEVILPVYTAAELMAAREEAAQEGRDLATAEADAASHVSSRLALAEIARQIAAARADVTVIAEQSAEAVARLLLDCFAAAFPALSARHGPDEVAAVVRTVLPSLHREPKIAIRLSPHTVDAVSAELRTLDPDLTARVRLVPTDAVTQGDVRITWENGAAARDTASLWSQIERTLTQAGLMNTEQTAKEHEVGE